MTIRPGLRKLALAVHLAVSVGWVGAVAAYLALDLTVVTSPDADTVRAAWIAMGAIVSWVIVPLAVAALLTGLVMSLGTRWGLFRHWWVLISLLLTVLATLVLLSEAAHISRVAEIALDPTDRSPHDLRPLGVGGRGTLLHSVGGLVVLLVIMVLNVYKPQGMTRYGWRKSLEERARAQRAGAGQRAGGHGSLGSGYSESAAGSRRRGRSRSATTRDERDDIPSVRAERPDGVAHVRSDRLDADAELGRALLVSQSAPEVVEDLPLALTERDIRSDPCPQRATPQAPPRPGLG